MSKIHISRSGFITKAALPSVSRTGTVPATYYAKLDESAGSTSLADSGPNNLTMTCSGSAAMSSSQAKFGSTSLLITSSTNDYGSLGINAGSGAFNFAANNWTVECWIYMTALPASGRLFEVITVQGASGTGVDGYACCRLAVTPTGSMYMLCTGATAATWINNSTTANSLIGTNTWYHLAGVRNGSNYTLYINGVSRLTYTFSGTQYNYAGYTTVGTNYANGSILGSYPRGGTAYIDAIRIFNGTAVYTSGFTPPSTLPDLSVEGGTVNNNVYGINQLL